MGKIHAMVCDECGEQEPVEADFKPPNGWEVEGEQTFCPVHQSTPLIRKLREENHRLTMENVKLYWRIKNMEEK